MFEFLFKRATDKPSDPQPAVAASEQTEAAALSASRREEQAGRARALGGDEAGAVALILGSEFAGVRLAAAEHVQSRAALEQVLAAMRNTDRRVAKLMQGRLDAIRYHEAEQQKAQACIATAQRLLLDEKLTPNLVADLDRQWKITVADADLAAQFDAARAALAARLEAQVSLQRAIIDALAEARQLAGAGLPPADAAQALARLQAAHADYLAAPEHGSLPKHLLGDFAQALEQAASALAAQDQALAQHGAAFDAREALLAEWQAAADDTLVAERMTRAWNGVARVPDGELAQRQQADFETQLARAPASVQPVPAAAAAAKEERKDGRPAKSAAPAKTVDKEFVDTLDAMEAALAQGLLHAASDHDKWLKEHKSGRLTPAQADRLAHVRAELKRLGDWARWGGNVSREELVKAVEDLPAQSLAMSELAKKVGSMRERWKSLDALSGHAPKNLWERFDAACTAAYAPAAAHFKHLADERHSNAAKAQALVDETLAMANAGAAHADWKNIAAAGQRLRQLWGRLGTIDRKEKKKLDTAFERALAALIAPLAEQRKLEVGRREQLIAEVEALTPHDRSTLDAVRRAQERWQEQAKALPLERKAEQALWVRFRAACDHVFAARKESAHAADSERRAHLHACEAICAGLETATFEGDDKAQLAAIAKTLRDAGAAWHAVGAVPRASEQKINQRYQSAVSAVQAQADAIKRRAGAAQANALRDKLRLTQALEGALAANVADASDGAIHASDWQQRWQALPPLSAEYERALQGRFSAALKAADGQRAAYAEQLERNRAKLLDEVLRLEIVSGVDSGAEFARERLKMQVEVLQSSLKSGQKQASAAAQYLALCAMPALADARTASRIEQLFRRVGSDGHK